MKEIDEPMTHGSWYVRHDLGPVLGPVDPKPFLWYDLLRQMERKEVLPARRRRSGRPAGHVHCLAVHVLLRAVDANALRRGLPYFYIDSNRS